MVHQASDIADAPPTREGRPVRRSLKSAVEAEHLAAGTRLLGVRGPVLMALFIAALMFPAALRLGPIRLAPYTALLIIFFIPMLLVFLRDKTNRIVALDVFMVAHIAWMAIAVLHAEGLGRIVFVVNTAVSSLGGYLLARVLIRSPEDYERFFRYFFYGLLFYMPFALFELVSNRSIINEYLAIVMEAIPHYGQDPRMGLTRVQGFTEHPITYGLFCSIGVANLFYIYRGKLFKQTTRTGTAVLMTLLSLSSAPTISVAMQFMMIGWDRLLRGVRYKWVMLIVLIGAPLLVLQIAAPHGLVGLVIENMSYDPVTGWARTEIFAYGSAEALRNPFLGIGFGEWERPFWRGPSVDNFWLLMAMRYGIPALLFLLVGLAIHAIRIMSQRELSEAAAGCRNGYLMVWVGVFFVLVTVHIWGSSAIFIMTYIGAGAWLYTGQGVDPAEANRYRRVREIERAGASARAEPAAAPQPTRAAMPRDTRRDPGSAAERQEKNLPNPPASRVLSPETGDLRAAPPARRSAAPLPGKSTGLPL